MIGRNQYQIHGPNDKRVLTRLARDDMVTAGAEEEPTGESHGP